MCSNFSTNNENFNPTAIISLSTPSIISYPVDSTVSVSATASNDVNGKIVTYEWKAGDSDWFTGNEVQNIPTPKNIDTIFVVSLKVTDDDGNTALTSVNLNLYGDTITDIRDGQRYAIETKNDYIWMAEDITYIHNDEIIIGDTLGNGFYYTYYNWLYWYFRNNNLDKKNMTLCPIGFNYIRGSHWNHPIYYEGTPLNDAAQYFSMRCETQNRIDPSLRNSGALGDATIAIVTNDVSLTNFPGDSTQYWAIVQYIPDNADIQRISWDVEVLQICYDTTTVYTITDQIGNSIAIQNIPTQFVPSKTNTYISPAGGLWCDYQAIITAKILDNLNREWKKTSFDLGNCYWTTGGCNSSDASAGIAKFLSNYIVEQQ